jgi:importin-4
MCAGQLASAVGKEKFPAHCIEVFTKYALEFLAMDKFELRETSISYFAELVRILKSDMAPIINQVLDEILKSCKSEAGMKTEVEQKPKEAFSLDSDSEDEAELVGMDVDVNFIDEKSAAVHALGSIGLFCSGLILPRLKEIIDVLSELADYFHENIRYHVCMTYLQIAVGLVRHFTQSDEKFKWEKGLPVKNPLPAPVVEYMEQVIFPHYFELFDHEDNKEVIEKTLECFREMCEVFGPAAVEKHSDRIVEVILLLLDKKAYCQTKGKEKGEKEAGMDEDEEADGFQDEDEEEDEDDDEDLDHDEIILGNTTDLIIELARALGDQFLTYLTRIGPSLVRYLDDTHPKSDIEMVIGCLAETFNACTAAIPVYFKDFLQILLKNSKTDDSSLNRNISYAIGVLAQHSGVLLGQHIQACLEALNTMYAVSTEQDAKDNIISASCRLMQYYPQ